MARAQRAHALCFTDLAVSQRTSNTAGDAGSEAIDALAVEVGNLRLAWRYWVAADDLEQLERMAKGLLILYDAHGWYLDIVGLARDMLMVLDRAPSAPNRAIQEIALRTILARALMVTQGFTPEVEKAYVGAVNSSSARTTLACARNSRSCAAFTASISSTGRSSKPKRSVANC